MLDKRPFKVCEGMKLKYTRSESFLCGRVVTVARTQDKEWYVIWPNGDHSCSGPICGIEDGFLSYVWEPVDTKHKKDPKVFIDLKKANTMPDATNCAKCFMPLKDPGFGPLYKHCPKCES